MATVRLLNPTELGPKESITLSPRVDTLNGKVVGFRIQWTRFDVFMNRFEEILRERYKVADVMKIQRQGQQRHTDEQNRQWEEMKAKADTAIVGLAA